MAPITIAANEEETESEANKRGSKNLLIICERLKLNGNTNKRWHNIVIVNHICLLESYTDTGGIDGTEKGVVDC